MKRTVPILICFATGALLLIHKLFPALSDLNQLANRFFILLAATAYVLGAGSFIRSHSAKIRKREAGWAYSTIALLAFAITFVVGIFKIGVPGLPGFAAALGEFRDDRPAAFCDVLLKENERTLEITLRGATPAAAYPVTLAGLEAEPILLGTLKTNERGRADMKVRASATDQDTHHDYLLRLDRRQTYALAIGDELRGTLAAHAWYTGQPNADGGALWFIFEFFFKPLQQMMFALLAFFIASAAFRAFRARNLESMLLLGTAFIVLLGRTALGVFLSDWAPREGPLALLFIPNLTDWIMNCWATAGNRAIMIGIALGIVSTSLKLLLGIERTYLGAEK